MRAIVAVVNKNGEDATKTVATMLKIYENKKTAAFGFASSTFIEMGKTTETLLRNPLASPVVIGHAFSKILSTDKPQPLKLSDATMIFEGRVYSTKLKISNTELIAQKLEWKEAFENLFTLDGWFAFAIAKQKKIIAGRDTMGVYPLYYGENSKFAALASEQKALWKIGIDNVNSFPPGHLAFIDKSGFQFKHVKTLTYSSPKKVKMHYAVSHLQKILQKTVKKSVFGLKEVAVAFSGGLDSSLIAFLAKNAGVHVHLVHVSLRNQSETEWAKKVAEELKLPIYVYLYNEENVKQVLSQVLWLIEEYDIIKASIAIPFFWTAEKAAQTDLNVLLAGQGADEFFGGYKRYVDYYFKYGEEKTHRMLFDEMCKMYKSNFERDFKICNFHNVELRLPFANYQVAKFVANLPVPLKITAPEDGLRKIVLRHTAENLGLPPFIAKKPKKAMQYSTGVVKALRKIASQNRLSLKEYLHQTFIATFKKRVRDG